MTPALPATDQAVVLQAVSVGAGHYWPCSARRATPGCS